MARPQVEDMLLPKRHRLDNPTTSNDSMSVFVAKVNRTTYVLSDVMLSDVVDKVKRKIESKTGIFAARQLVMYAGKVLQDCP